MDDQAPHVLIVDDEEDIRVLLGELLGQCGFRVTIAADAQKARQAIDSGDFVDVAVIDAVLPGELGAFLAEHVAALGIPIVLISGNPDAMQHDVLAAVPCVRLSKPFSAENAVAAVRAAMRPAFGADETAGRGDLAAPSSDPALNSRTLRVTET